MSWCIPWYSPAYSRVFAGSVNGVVVGLLVSLRVLAYPVAFWRILAESFGILRKFVRLYGSQPHPRNRASRFYVLTGGGKRFLQPLNVALIPLVGRDGVDTWGRGSGGRGLVGADAPR